MDFLEYMTNLAPEGETFLVVRQKPQLKDKQMQYHADGAMLPRGQLRGVF